MARKQTKKKVDTYCEFQDVSFPCNVLAVGQPNRVEVLEGETYKCVDKVGQNLVILDSRGRELFFHKQWFVLLK
jgi:5-methylcytosine-specific restriction endonuclease McrBC GTP-binding regulatory subunit McrB